MKLAVCASGDNLQANADPRFGRCPYFVIVDSETMEFTAIETPGGTQGSGAGIAAAQVVARTDAEAVIAGNYGPNAHKVLSEGGLKAYTGARGTVKETVEAFRAGQLEAAGDATVPAHFGEKDDS